jgi:hypothetical protein
MTQKKEAKTKIKVRDLKPRKDAKGGSKSNNNKITNVMFGG